MIKLGCEVTIIVPSVLVGAIHCFEQVNQFFVNHGHCDALLLQSQRCEPLLDHLNLGILGARLHSHRHLLTIGRPVQLVEHLERDVLRRALKEVHLEGVRVDLLLLNRILRGLRLVCALQIIGFFEL